MFIFDLTCNLFDYFTFTLFISYFSKLKNKTNIYRTVYLIYLLIFSCIPEIPYSGILSFAIDFIYLLYMADTSFKQKLKLYAFYNAYFVIASAIVYTIHTLLARDIYITHTTPMYAQYKYIICSTLMYIILSMYIITKRISSFPSGQVYKRYFLTIMSISVVLLTVCSMLLGSSFLLQEQVLPLLFSLLIIITVLFLVVYRKLVAVLEESALHKIEAETNALQQDYYAHVEENLKTLSLLRHDFKNHLLILDSYTRQGENEKVLNYIQTIQKTLAPASLIQTPSALLSSLLNAKNEDCKRKKVVLHFEQAFPFIKMDDFHLVTIMSNLLDNAITAAAKCPAGEITLQIRQLDSFLEITCSNNHQEKLIPAEDFFLTTKTEHKEIHGLGITSMRKAVDNLHGKMSIEYTDDIFYVNILVPNYE